MEEYMAYTSCIEVPKIYNRWSLISVVGAALGRNMAIRFGDGKIHANMYIYLIGDPGARKSTAIKLIAKLLASAGYETFASSKTTKEKFIADLAGISDDEAFTGKKLKAETTDKTLENLWGSIDGQNSKEPKHVYISADEFVTFTTPGNTDFYTLLADLWDWDNEQRPFEDRVKTKASCSIWQPTINMIGGFTQETFIRCFPANIAEYGFLSRIIIIHGEKVPRQIAWPEPHSPEETALIVDRLKSIMRKYNREYCEVSQEAKNIISDIYKEFNGVDDVRFSHYTQRRHTHLIKLCIIISVILFKDTIDAEVVITANTILTAAERLMPRALGEFGKGRNSDVTNKIITTLSTATRPLTASDLWAKHARDMGKIADLQEIINNLNLAGRIQTVNGGFLLKKEATVNTKYIDWNLLTPEERDYL